MMHDDCAQFWMNIFNMFNLAEVWACAPDVGLCATDTHEFNVPNCLLLRYNRLQ